MDKLKRSMAEWLMMDANAVNHFTLTELIGFGLEISHKYRDTAFSERFMPIMAGLLEKTNPSEDGLAVRD